MLIDSEFDIVTNFAAQQWATDLALPILKMIKGKKVFVPTGFSGLFMPSYKIYYQAIPERMKEYDMNIFLSNNYRDINLARENNIENIIIIPNGADEREFLYEFKIDFRKKYGISNDDFFVLHVGSKTGFKGHYEALKIFSKAKVDNAVLVMIGNNSNGIYKNLMKFFDLNLKHFNKSSKQKSRNKRVIVISTSREETIEAFKESDIFLFPSNIECSPLVLFECMAAKTPFMTNDVGNAKEIVEWSNSGVVLPTMKAGGMSKAKIWKSARLLEEVYKDKNNRIKMAESGFKAWTERFTWDIIACEYEKLYLNLLNNSYKK